jgi:Restriction endonuclease
MAIASADDELGAGPVVQSARRATVAGMSSTRLRPHERGRMFEHLIDALFRAHGFATHTNAIVVGRSGARHELDILASRREDLLETRVGVECKNWAHPIDTAVVARARLIRDDIGLGQMVIACAGGATPAARTTAAQSGITLWERAELETRLGAAAIAALGPAPTSAARRGVARRIELARAERTLQAEMRGPLGITRAQVRWLGNAWIPLLEVRFGCGERAGLRQRLRVRAAYTTYEALTGAACWTSAGPVARAEDLVDPAPTLTANVGATALAAELTRLIDRSETLVQPTARERHDDACRALMMPAAAYVSVDEITAVDWPICLAIVDDRRGSRALVVDATRGRVDADLGERCTAQLASVVEQLGIPLGAATP